MSLVERIRVELGDPNASVISITRAATRVRRMLKAAGEIPEDEAIILLITKMLQTGKTEPSARANLGFGPRSEVDAADEPNHKPVDVMPVPPDHPTGGGPPLTDEEDQSLVLARFLNAKLNGGVDTSDVSLAELPASTTPVLLSSKTPLQRILECFVDADPDYVKKTIKERTTDHLTEDEIVQNVLQFMCDGYERIDPKKKAEISDFLSTRDFRDKPFYPKDKEIRKWNCDFLANWFPFIPYTRIHAALADVNYCLTLAWDILTNDTGNPLRRRRVTRTLSSDSKFTICRHETDQYQILAARLQEKQRLVQAAMEAGDMVECNVCFDDFPRPTTVPCSEDKHHICEDCYKSYITTEIFENGNAATTCVAPDCNGHYRECYNEPLPERTRQAFARAQTRAALAAAGISEETHECPTCGDCVIVPAGNHVHDCIHCGTATCILCDEKSHLPQRCDEVEKDDEVAARRKVEEAMTLALLRNCECGKSFLKESGCNKMTCKCGLKMCYLCKEQITGYDHFCRKPHCDKKKCGKCHLYGDYAVLDKARVTDAGKKTLAEVKDEHPELRVKVDTGFLSEE